MSGEGGKKEKKKRASLYIFMKFELDIDVLIL